MYLDFLDKIRSSGSEDNNYAIAGKIEVKVQKWMNKHIDDLEDLQIEPEMWKELITSVLGAYSQHRPDIGFMSGLEKLTAQILMVYLPY
jgi:hypothetical protein